MSLARLLAPFQKGNYETLFTPKSGYPVKNSETGTWSLHRIAASDLPTYFQNLKEQIVKDKEFENLATEALIQRVNACATNVMPLARSKGTEKTIHFNSKSGETSFLSNFFDTLILFPDPLHPDRVRIYPSAEQAYQVHKLTELRTRALSGTSGGGGSADGDSLSYVEDWTGLSATDFESLLDEVLSSTPQEAKRLASTFRGPSTDETAVMKSTLMTRIVMEKFRQNPVLQAALRSTRDAHLVEDTNDAFWGAKDPHDSTLKRSYVAPISTSSRNVLGRILMSTRAALS
jgi:ribA/ribD-fused uncharacterized protein